MNKIYFINLIMLSITILGYCLVFPGMILQIPLGILQVFFAILIQLSPKKNSKLTKNLNIYWAILGVYGLTAAFIATNKILSLKDWMILTGLFVVPMLIALYFTYVTHLYKITINK